MNTEAILKIRSTESAETESFGEKIGCNLKGGEVIELVSDIGGGKTTLVRGLAKGAGSTDIVASPTFTVSKLYQAKDFDIHHFDFYRLDDPGILKHELAEFLDDKQSVIVIEWAGIVKGTLPEERLKIHITTDGEHSRMLEVQCPPRLNYLVKDLG